MVIEKFEVKDGWLTIRLQDMPRSATVDNTTVWIEGTRLAPPVEVSPLAYWAQTIKIAAPQQKGFILVSIRMDTGIPETAKSTELYLP
jgi:hypothetical protein